MRTRSTNFERRMILLMTVSTLESKGMRMGRPASAVFPSEALGERASKVFFLHGCLIVRMLPFHPLLVALFMIMASRWPPGGEPKPHSTIPNAFTVTPYAWLPDDVESIVGMSAMTYVGLLRDDHSTVLKYPPLDRRAQCSRRRPQGTLPDGKIKAASQLGCLQRIPS
jgi:hypothetical protein